MTAIETIEKAATLARIRLNQAPDYELFVSIVAQLDYLLSVLTGAEKDRSRVKEIIVGHYAVREFAESDPEFAEVLKVAQFIASQTAKGLKV